MEYRDKARQAEAKKETRKRAKARKYAQKMHRVRKGKSAGVWVL